MARKFRIGVKTRMVNTYYRVEEKKWGFWLVVADWIGTEEEALNYIRAMKESDNA